MRSRFQAADAQVSFVLDAPEAPVAGYVMAHGAGAGMDHSFLARMAAELVRRRIAVFRYQFPYMEARRPRPDSPNVAVATVRAAVEEAGRLLPSVPLVAGGKSFGGRMTSTAAADAPLPGVVGLAFLGFPLHAPGKPGVARAEHLSRVTVPMLFLQGTRDSLAQLPLVHGVVAELGSQATLHVVEGGDHSFAVPRGSGRSAAMVFDELADTMVAWLGRLG